MKSLIGLKTKMTKKKKIRIDQSEKLKEMHEVRYLFSYEVAIRQNSYPSFEEM